MSHGDKHKRARRHLRAVQKRRGSAYIEAVVAVTMITLLFAGVVFFYGMYHSKLLSLREARQQAWLATLAGEQFDCDDQVVGIGQLAVRSSKSAMRIATAGQLTAMTMQSSTTMTCNEVPTENENEDKGAIDFLVDRAIMGKDAFLDAAKGMLTDFF